MLTQQERSAEATVPDSGGGVAQSVSAEGRWRTWYWALVPLLGMAAYFSVLWIGFLSDDFMLLASARRTGLSLSTLLPEPNWIFLRPVGNYLTWQVGWFLWGFNPVPYHIVGLLLHGGTSLALGLWLGEATGQPCPAWLASALFAVFPLHLEAVGWIAAQWDLLAAFFGLSSLWLFTVWWNNSARRPLYALAVVLYTLALFSKESVILFLAVFGLSAWLATPHFSRPAVTRLGLGLLPFMGVLAAYIGIRYLTWGGIGGYTDTTDSFGAQFFDRFLAYISLLVSPVNTAIFGPTAGQVVAALFSMAILAGLVWYGRKAHRVLIAAGGWIVCAVVPILTVPSNITGDLQQNRLLYLACAGFCVGTGTLLYMGLMSMGHRRSLAPGIGGLIIVLGMSMSWIQLGPWHTATAQSIEIQQQVDSLIPPVAARDRPQGMAWYVENIPDNYRGAYIYRLGLSWHRRASGKDTAQIENVQDYAQANLTGDERDAFALRFAQSADGTHFYVDQANGVTAASEPPVGDQAGFDLAVWDFRECVSEVVGQWQAAGVEVQCAPGEGMLLDTEDDDPFIVAQGLSIVPQDGTGSFVRIRVSVSYLAEERAEPYRLQWYWSGPGEGGSEERSRSMQIKQNGMTHVYWTFIPASEVDETITGLRFDPINGQVGARIQWIAVDVTR